MIKFLVKIIVFLIIGYCLGEGIVRIFHLSVDVQNVYQDSAGMIRNEPNQTGYDVNGTKWMINKYGEFGYEPPSLDSLITVIGDSYIVNKMNPPRCHQAAFLKSMTSGFNFYPRARSGAGFIEFMEMTKDLNHLHPIKQLLYVHHGDFIESIKELENQPLIVQYSVNSNKIIYPRLTQSKLKKVLYHFKFAYYLYRNYFLSNDNGFSNNRDDKSLEIDYDKIKELLQYVNSNYRTDNVILVFSPDSDPAFTEFVKKYNFHTLSLESNDYKSWQLPNNSHWSCRGHEEAAKQVAKFLNNAQRDKTLYK